MLNRGTQPLSDSRITQLVADRDDARQMAAAWTATYDVVVDVSGTEPAHMRHLPLPADVSRYVFVSTAAVYSRKSVTPPFREDDQANGDAIWGGYGEAKATCERLLHEALPEWSLTVLRPPYIYGPHNTEQREQFLWARMAADQPIFVPGDGSTQIQFCASWALADTVVAAIEGQLPAGTYNVAEARGYTFHEYLAVASPGGRPRKPARSAAGPTGPVVDVTCWLRPDAHTSPQRILCHTYGRGKDQHLMIPSGRTRSSSRWSRAVVRGPRRWTRNAWRRVMTPPRSPPGSCARSRSV